MTGLPFIEVRNPHHPSEPPMRLWKEEVVLLHRSEAEKAVFQTRKTDLVEWWKQVYTENPRVHEIVKRLWEIGERISLLHKKREECRGRDPDYDSWETSAEHCRGCEDRTRRQKELRKERASLFSELESICGKNKGTIQLARRYYRTEKRKARV